MDIEVITVETEHAGEVFPGSREDIRQYLEDQGYVHVYNLAGNIFSTTMKYFYLEHHVSVDDVFVRKDLYDGKYAPDLKMQKRLEDLRILDFDEAKKILKEEDEIKEKKKKLKEEEAINNKKEEL